MAVCLVQAGLTTPGILIRPGDMIFTHYAVAYSRFNKIQLGKAAELGAIQAAAAPIKSIQNDLDSVPRWRKCVKEC